jgi:hypothetical protein
MKTLITALIVLCLLAQVSATSIMYDVCDNDKIDVAKGSDLWITSSYAIKFESDQYNSPDRSSTIGGKRIWVTRVDKEGSIIVTEYNTNCTMIVNVYDPESKRRELLIKEQLDQCSEALDNLTTQIVVLNDKLRESEELLDRKDLQIANLTKIVNEQNDIIQNKYVKVIDKYVYIDDPKNAQLFFDKMFQSLGPLSLMKFNWFYLCLIFILGALAHKAYQRKIVSGEK